MATKAAARQQEYRERKRKGLCAIEIAGKKYPAKVIHEDDIRHVWAFVDALNASRGQK